MSKIHELSSFDVQKVFLSATLSKYMEDELARQMNLVDYLTVWAPTNRPPTSYRVQVFRDSELMDKFLMNTRDRCGRMSDGQKMIVYCPSIDLVDTIAAKLDCPRYYHNWLYKDNDMERFLNDPKSRFIIGTSAIGCGIDVSSVTDIVHYGRLYEMYSFVQSTGRGGRSGEHVIPLCTLSEEGYNIHKGASSNANPDTRAASGFATTRECPRNVISQHQDSLPHPCSDGDDLCDNCMLGR